MWITYRFILVKYILHHIQVILPKWAHVGLRCDSDSVGQRFKMISTLDLISVSVSRRKLFFKNVSEEVRDFVRSKLLFACFISPEADSKSQTTYSKACTVRIVFDVVEYWTCP